MPHKSPVTHRTSRNEALRKGTDARGFTSSPPMEKGGAGGSIPKAVSGGVYKDSPIPIQSAPLKNPTKSPAKGLRGG